MSKVVLVTGGSRGIGAAVSRLAGRQGYAVGVNYNRDADAARRVVADIEAAGSRAVAVQGSVADQAQVRDMFGQVTAALGPISAASASMWTRLSLKAVLRSGSTMK